MDTSEPLLPSEGVYWQLGIVTYHTEVDAQAQKFSAPASVPHCESTASAECQVTAEARSE